MRIRVPEYFIFPERIDELFGREKAAEWKRQEMPENVLVFSGVLRIDAGLRDRRKRKKQDDEQLKHEEEVKSLNTCDGGGWENRG